MSFVWNGSLLIINVIKNKIKNKPKSQGFKKYIFIGISLKKQFTKRFDCATAEIYCDN